MKLKTVEIDGKTYAEMQDGKPVFVYDDGKTVAFDVPAAVSKISALNAEAKSHREAKEAAEAKAKAFEGIEDAEAARKALETIKNIDEGKLIAAGKVEEIKTAAQRAAQEQVAAASKLHAEELTRTKAELAQERSERYALQVGGAFSSSKFIGERSAIPADLVQAKFGSAFKVEDGKIVAYDASGNKIFSRSRPGEVADFEEAIETLIEQYPHKDQILKASGASGGGAPGNSGSGGGTQKGNFGGTRDERKAAIAARFPDLAKA